MKRFPSWASLWAFFRLVATIFLLLPTASLAGHIVGNGGSVVDCPGRVPEKETLDLFEARSQGLPLRWSGEPLSHQEILARVLAGLAVRDPQRAKAYGDQALTFEGGASWLRGVTLTPINDSHHLFVPAGCTLRQAAVQNLPRPNPYGALVVDADIWDSLDAMSRAALLIHEVVYHEAIGFGHTDSRPTRRFVGLLFSRDPGSLTEMEYLAFLRDNGFPRLSGVDLGTFLSRAEVLAMGTSRRTLLVESECRGSPLVPGTRKERLPAGTAFAFTADEPVAQNPALDRSYILDPNRVPWMRVTTETGLRCYVAARRDLAQ